MVEHPTHPHPSREMTPFSQSEWQLLHRAMDQVDARRKQDAGLDLDRIKSVALATYRSQGIEVDETLVDQVVSELAGPGATNHASARHLILDLESLRKAEAAGLLRERRARERQRKEQPHQSTMARFLDHHRRREAPYLAHRPLDDTTLLAHLDGFLGRIGPRLKRQRASVLASRGAGAVAAAVCAWMSLIAAGLVPEPAPISLGWGLLAWWMGLVGALLGFGIGRATHADWLLGCMRAMAVVRGRQALADKRYTFPDLTKGLAAVGLLAVSDMTPMDDQARRAADRQVEAMKGIEDHQLKQVWKAWATSGAPLRHNDLAVLMRWARVRASHPFRASQALARRIRSGQGDAAQSMAAGPG